MFSTRLATRFGARTASSALKARAFSTGARASAAGARKSLFVGAAVAATAGMAYYQTTQTPILADSKNVAGVKGTDSERTFIMIKPDGVQRGLVGKIVSRFEDRGYKLVAIKSVAPSKELAERHYADLKSKPFFPSLVEYMSNGAAPVVAMVWEGSDVIRQGRAMLGATSPLDAAPGTLRGQYCVSIGRNAIHGSDSYEAAQKEIAMWFPQAGELVSWTPANWTWVMSNN
ncbi:nucleoside diphosphate kinase [Umbelopsis sp. PMI_123]|nr:nucleoside diphosphate kinase [Umbelopsis sp. PMI_123]